MRFRIRQNGKTIVSVEGSKAESEVLRYAGIYREEGEITVQYWTGTHWKRWALFCQWPAPAGDPA